MPHCTLYIKTYSHTTVLTSFEFFCHGSVTVGVSHFSQIDRSTVVLYQGMLGTYLISFAWLDVNQGSGTLSVNHICCRPYEDLSDSCFPIRERSSIRGLYPGNRSKMELYFCDIAWLLNMTVTLHSRLTDGYLNCYANIKIVIIVIYHLKVSFYYIWSVGSDTIKTFIIRAILLIHIRMWSIQMSRGKLYKG